jgi:CRP-like cAMP-binding protein
MGGHSVGSLHILNKDPAYATAKCASDVVVYELDASILNQKMLTDPKLSWNIAYSLSMEIRRFTNAQRTPLLEQHPKKTPFVAVSVAAAVESFYR